MLGECIQEGRRGRVAQGRGRGQGNFKLAANFGYDSRGSADPRESLRKRRILKLALTAHKVSPPLCYSPSADFSWNSYGLHVLEPEQLILLIFHIFAKLNLALINLF